MSPMVGSLSLPYFPSLLSLLSYFLVYLWLSGTGPKHSPEETREGTVFEAEGQSAVRIQPSQEVDKAFPEVRASTCLTAKESDTRKIRTEKSVCLGGPIFQD